MITAAVGTSSQALWYFVRATGLVDLVLLTAVMVLGVAEVTRFSAPGWPRFVWAALHRNLSLLAVVLLLAHVLTTVTDTYVNISVVSVVVPFVSGYAPIWVGLGAVAFDLMVAVAVTSLARRSLGLGAWRAVHWMAYLCWPLAVAHGLGMGTDSGVGWVDGLNAVCIAAVVAAAGWRIWVTRRGLSRPGQPHVSDPLARVRSGR